MGYSKEIYSAATQLIQDRRLKAEKDAEIRQKEIFAKDAEVERITRELSLCGVQAAKAVLYGGDVHEQMNNLKAKSLALQEELKDRLLFNGYEATALEPHYNCTICNDTGYYEQQNKTLVCDCFRKALVKCSCDSLNRTSPLSLCTFKNFTLDYYNIDVSSNSVSDYENMSKILSFCKKYSTSFNANSKNLLMIGPTGLGKTHLSLAIANEVIQMGFGVVYVSSPDILSKLEKEHFSNSGREEETLSAL